jgi:hypothetical protein
MSQPKARPSRTFARPSIISITATDSSRRAYPHRNDKVEENDSGAGHEDGNGLADAPKCSDQGRPHAVPLITDDGCDCDHGVGGVTHP